MTPALSAAVFRFYILFLTAFFSTSSTVQGASILSAYLGAINVPAAAFYRNVNNNCLALSSNQQTDGMPVSFDVQIDLATLRPQQFLVTLTDGNKVTPECASLAPADDANELYTVLLVGDMGSQENLPVQVEIQEAPATTCLFGSMETSPAQTLYSVDGQDLTGLSIANVTYGFASGPSMILAFLFPGAGPNGQDQVQTVWNGGITADQGVLFPDTDLPKFVLVDAMGGEHVPTAFADDGDIDNFLVLNVPANVTHNITSVYVVNKTAYDPLNFPNQYTTVPVQLSML